LPMQMRNSFSSQSFTFDRARLIVHTRKLSAVLSFVREARNVGEILTGDGR
jgi:hypothetical protein